MKRERRPLVAGNWKMNVPGAAIDLIGQIAARVVHSADQLVDVAICPPATILGACHHKNLGGDTPGDRSGGLILGGQDCHVDDKGAHTGDVSAQMLRDAGASLVIVGHSERRADHRESSEEVAAKAQAAWRAGLTAVICVGETLDDREAGRAVEIVTGQIDASVPLAATDATTIVAYEPVWAIGTGKTPTLDDVAQMHAAIRARLAERLGAGISEKIRILYGGSVKPENAGTLLNVANVDGALVGGASLKVEDFWGIIKAYL